MCEFKNIFFDDTRCILTLHSVVFSVMNSIQ